MERSGLHTYKETGSDTSLALHQTTTKDAIETELNVEPLPAIINSRMWTNS